MNRPIMFRLIGTNGKVCGYEKWYAGEFDKNGQWRAQPCWLYSKDGDFWNPKPIFHRKKNEFCGLHDKNGKEIYEGDVVEDGTGFLGQVGWMTRDDEEQSYHGWTLYYGSPDKGDCEGIYPRMCEVIGNIYENPNLLKP